MNKAGRCTVVVAVLLAAALQTRAAELTNAEEVLNFAAAKEESCNSFTADFIQKMDAFGSSMEMTGKIDFKKPALLRMNMSMPMMGQTQAMVAVMGPDKVVWQEMTAAGQTRVMKLDFQKIPTNSPAAAYMKNPVENIDPKQQLAQARERYTFEMAPAAELQGQKMYVLMGTLRPNAKLAPQEASILFGLGKQRIFIGQQDGFMRRLEQLDKSGSNTVMAMEFSNIKLNTSLPDSLFIYKPAPDANVVDVAQMVLQMMNGTKKPAPKAPAELPPAPAP